MISAKILSQMYMVESFLLTKQFLSDSVSDNVSMVEIINQSELPKTRPLERFRRNNVDSAPRYAHISRLSNGQYVTFWQDSKVVVDVICWTITETAAKKTGQAQQKFYDMEGYPRGREAVIVKLGA